MSKENVLEISEVKESKEIKEGKAYDPAYVKNLEKENIKWRHRAKENEDAIAKADEADKRSKEAETRANNTLLEVTKMQQLANKRLIDAELKSLAAELGLKELKYTKLGEGYDKLNVNENGDVEGARVMMEKLKQTDPDLFKSATTTNVNFQGNTRTVTQNEKKKALNMSNDEYAKAEREFLKNAK